MKPRKSPIAPEPCLLPRAKADVPRPIASPLAYAGSASTASSYCIPRGASTRSSCPAATHTTHAGLGTDGGATPGDILAPSVSLVPPCLGASTSATATTPVGPIHSPSVSAEPTEPDPPRTGFAAIAARATAFGIRPSRGGSAAAPRRLASRGGGRIHASLTLPFSPS